MKLSLGFSPCPNDTYIFDALVNHKIDTEGLSFDVHLEDVQTLNEWALEGKLQCSKVSYGVLPLLLDQYKLLNAGGALGVGVGPLLIARTPEKNMADSSNWTVAIPGRHTTAHVLFSKAFPEVTQKRFMLFHEIESAVLNGEVDAGVIIHENRFTYQQKGLHKIIDLGAYWEETTRSAIPLGGIVVHQSVDKKIAQQLNQLIVQSILYSDHQYPLLSDFIQEHAQAMSDEVMRQHIGLYVNEYSKDLGETGKKAIHSFIEEYERMNQLSIKADDIYW
ncbi:1,4-dihydroxy-6-naphthoate synthase [Gynurincola endophyticus]|uniref:1,4-dihydroxy-6-naphthoate synthase n=1 Tax=Gynurincola endophyticus TaxID=2479004 RepID=UPI000F8C679F|nr:1,4-dihydroxy-6-naphthoate synthase [Gynurincola endophyticus]